MSDVRSPSRPLEMWAGPECTVNRVGNRYFDQIERTGHARRAEDLDRFASLGVRTLRYPILWERTAPGSPSRADWSWSDERLERLRTLGIRPIVGLVHHGSGPSSTDLLDDGWADRLAEFAAAVAERYPWVDAYTPVNEPVTTARFSALYGHWYPHLRADRAFAGAVLHQLKAVVLSMRAIRRVNPAAILVQTEDLGFVRSTPRLAYQARFENERRWLTFDLLTGRFRPNHPIRKFFRSVGIAEPALRWFEDNPCPPDIVGLNYYVISERYLDDDPVRAAGWAGNGRDRYLDIEAVRSVGLVGLGTLLGQAWDRYRIPIAVTEVHLAGTRDEQLRWLVECWSAAEHAARTGAVVRAVTAWSLLGAYDWDSLCTEERQHYEPGAFDVRGPSPRPTALANAIATFAAGGRPDHPVLAGPGWWNR